MTAGLIALIAVQHNRRTTSTEAACRWKERMKWRSKKRDPLAEPLNINKEIMEMHKAKF